MSNDSIAVMLRDMKNLAKNQSNYWTVNGTKTVLELGARILTLKLAINMKLMQMKNAEMIHSNILLNGLKAVE